MGVIIDHTLEVYLAWYYNLKIVDKVSTVFDTSTDPHRTTIFPTRTLTSEEFAELVKFYEPSCNTVEEIMDYFDESGKATWRLYGSHILRYHYSVAEEALLKRQVCNYLATIGKRQVIL